MYAGLLACGCITLWNTSEVNISLMRQQDWGNDATTHDAGLALTLLSSSKAMSC